MRSRATGAVFLVGGLLLAGCVKPRVITAVTGIDAAGPRSMHEPGSVQARDSIGEVRLGHGLDRDGKVPPGFSARDFAVGDPIHLSLWEVTDGPAGSMVRVAVVDATDRIVWSEDRQAPHGGSYLSFGIGRKLPRGTYRADVIVANEVKSRTGFEVFQWGDR